MKQFLLRLSLLALLFCMNVAVFGYDFELDGIRYDILSDKTVSLQSNSDAPYSGNFIIPKEVKYVGNTYTVVEIGRAAFEGCVLSSLSIPNSIKTIKSNAFRNCHLTELEIPEGVEVLEDNAIAGCSKLQILALPKSINSYGNINLEGFDDLFCVKINKKNLYTLFNGNYSINTVILGDGVEEIGNYAFADCRYLTTVIMSPNIKRIGSEAFSGCSSLTSIELPEGIETIGQFAFHGCSALNSIKLPSKLQTIKNGLFEGCIFLENIVIPQQVKEIEQNAFRGCCRLDSVLLPSNLTSIGSSAFKGCSSLSSIDIPRGVNSLKSVLFEGCTSLTSVTLHEGLSNIEGKVFEGCRALNSLTIPLTVTNIGGEAFANCPNLTLTLMNEHPIKLTEEVCANSLIVPKGSTVAYAKADFWKDADKICALDGTTKRFPAFFKQDGETIATMDGDYENGIEVSENDNIILRTNNNFSQCDLIMRGGFEITDSIISGEYSFNPSIYWWDNTISTYSYGRNVVNVDTSGTLIDLVGVDNVENIESIKISGELNGTDILAIRKMTNLKLLNLKDAKIVNGGMSYYKDYVTSENKIGIYFFTDIEKLMHITLPTSIEDIDCDLLGDCPNLVSLTIPQNVTHIFQLSNNKECKTKSITFLCPYASTSAASLKLVVLGDKVETISFGGRNIRRILMGNCKLKNIYGIMCEQLESLTIPEGVEKIGHESFWGCNSLTSVELPQSLKSIGFSAFRDCKSLTSVVIPNGIETLEGSLFDNCISLANVKLPSSLKEIGSQAFIGCISLKKISIPQSVTEIGSMAFCGCTRLKELAIPNGVTSIGSDAFSNTNLRYMTLPPNIESIDYVFRNCPTLRKVEMHDDVKSMSGSFSGCLRLSSVKIPQGVTQLSGNTFYGCLFLETIIIPKSIKSIGSGAFGGCARLKRVIFEKGDTPLTIAPQAFVLTAMDSLYIGRNVANSEPVNPSYIFHPTIRAVTIDENVTSIGKDFFAKCYNLKSIYSLNPTPPEIGYSTFDSYNYKNATLFIPQGSKTLYWLHPYWEKFFNVVDNIPTSIEPIVFNSNSPNDRCVYNLNGTKVDSSSLGKGIYIKNGKKVIIK